MRKYLALLLILAPVLACHAAESQTRLLPFKENIYDHASLQRGAKIFFNYCAGCHSLQYMRYGGMARDIGIVDDWGHPLENLLKKSIIFTGAKITDPILSAMYPEEAKRWFGVTPPDLTLEVRVRGARWVYTYLRTFYKDPDRPWGSNNMIYPDVAMPNVLLNLQGEQLPVYDELIVTEKNNIKRVKRLDSLKPLYNGALNSEEFDKAVTDLVNFLAYVAEPMKPTQYRLGRWVLLFLLAFAVVCYLLKKEYWKDIHK